MSEQEKEPPSADTKEPIINLEKLRERAEEQEYLAEPTEGLEKAQIEETDKEKKLAQVSIIKTYV